MVVFGAVKYLPNQERPEASSQFPRRLAPAGSERESRPRVTGSLL